MHRLVPVAVLFTLVNTASPAGPAFCSDFNGALKKCFEDAGLDFDAAKIKMFAHQCDDSDKVLQAHDCAVNVQDECKKGRSDYKEGSAFLFTNEEVEFLMAEICKDRTLDVQCIGKVVENIDEDSLTQCFRKKTVYFKAKNDCMWTKALSECLVEVFEKDCGAEVAEATERGFKRWVDNACTEDVFG